MLKRVKVKRFEMGLLFKNGELKKVLKEGQHWINQYIGEPVQIFSGKDLWLKHDKLDEVAKSGLLNTVAKVVDLNENERAFVWIDGKLTDILKKGIYVLWTSFHKVKVDIVSQKDSWICSSDLDIVVKSGLLGDDAEIIDIKNDERALVWIDKRFDTILSPGCYAIWKNVKDINVEVVSTNEALFNHKDFKSIVNSKNAISVFTKYEIAVEHVGLYFLDGKFKEELTSGTYAFWKNAGKVAVYVRDKREMILDIAGQDLLTADKVTLRLNVVVSYNIADALKNALAVDDISQAIYRESQLAIRAVVGARELDKLFVDKDEAVKEMTQMVAQKAEQWGVNIMSIGIRDIILPGEMKNLLNKVVEAKKAAEANLIVRREETAAMRSQVNTAKMLENNPTLMRIRELEVLEKVASNSKLNVILGEKGLTDKVVNLL